MYKLISFLCLFSISQTVKAQWSPIYNTNSNAGRTVFAVDSDLVFAAAGQDIYKSSNGGNTWTSIFSDPLLAVEELYFSDTQTGFAAGRVSTGGHLLLSTTDGGQNWTPYAPSFPPPPFNGFNALNFPSATTGYVVGSDGRYVKTTNSGVTWTEHTVSVTNPDLIDVQFLSDDVGYFLGRSQIGRTQDGGNTINWTDLQSQSIFAKELFFYTPNSGYIATLNRELYQTTDGGLTWTYISDLPPTQSALFFFDKSKGYAATENGKFYKTTNGGEDWYFQNEQEGAYIKNMHFLNEDYGYAISGFVSNSFIYKTENGGGIAANVDVPDKVCAGDSILLNVEALGMPTIDWKYQGNSISTNQTAIIVPLIEQIDTVILALSNLGASRMDTFIIDVEGPSVPNFVVSSSKDSVCLGDSLSFSFTNTSNAFQLSVYANGVPIINKQYVNSNTLFIPVLNINENTIFEFYKDDLGCNPYLLFSKLVNVVNPPNANLSFQLATNPICENSPAEVIITNPEQNIEYQILLNSNPAGNKIRNQNVTPFTFPSYQLQDTGYIKVRAHNGSACFRDIEDSLALEMMQVHPDFTISGQNIMAGQSVDFTNYSSDTLTVEWQFGATAIPSQSTAFDPPSVEFSTGGSQVVSLIATTPMGCLDTAFRTIQVGAMTNLSDEWVLNHSPIIYPQEKLFFVDKLGNSFSLNDLENIQTTFGQPELNNPNRKLTKHDNKGVLQWSKNFQGENANGANIYVQYIDLNVDLNGNIFISLEIYSLNTPNTLFLADENPIVVDDRYASFLIKLDENGRLIWYVHLEGNTPSSGKFAKISTDSAGNIFSSITGISQTTLHQTNGIDTSFFLGNSVEDGHITKIDTNGNLVWTNYFPYYGYNNHLNTPYSYIPKHLASDGHGGVYILADGIAAFQLTRYDENGEVWNLQAEGSSTISLQDPYSIAQGLAVDEKNNAYFLMSSSGSYPIKDYGSQLNNTASIGKVDSQGNLHFVRNVNDNIVGNRYLGDGLAYNDGFLYLKTWDAYSGVFQTDPVCSYEPHPNDLAYISTWDSLGNLVHVLPFRQYTSGSFHSSPPYDNPNELYANNSGIYMAGINSLEGSLNGNILENQSYSYARTGFKKDYLPYISYRKDPFNTLCRHSFCSGDTVQALQISPVFTDIIWSIDSVAQPQLNTASIVPEISGVYTVQAVNPLGQTVQTPKAVQVQVNPSPFFGVSSTSDSIVAPLHPNYFYTLFDTSGNVVIPTSYEQNVFYPTVDGPFFVEIKSGQCTVRAFVQFPGNLPLTDNDNDNFLSDYDCNDNDPLINPLAEEIPNNNVDENCDGIALIIDEDSDGFNSDEDCDDNNPAINPDAIDIPNNGIDEDCDGMDATIHLSEVSNTDVVLYPNPFSNTVLIQSKIALAFDLKVCDLYGRIIHSSRDNTKSNLSVHTNTWGAGVYFFEIQQGGKIKRFRMVKH